MLQRNCAVDAKQAKRPSDCSNGAASRLPARFSPRAGPSFVEGLFGECTLIALLVRYRASASDD